MLTSLMFAVNASHPLQFPFFFLSLPNFVAPVRDLYKDRARLAAELTGLSPFPSRRFLAAHAGMIELYDIYHCHGIEIDDHDLLWKLTISQSRTEWLRADAKG